jgi:hypothetical protein
MTVENTSEGPQQKEYDNCCKQASLFNPEENVFLMVDE